MTYTSLQNTILHRVETGMAQLRRFITVWAELSRECLPVLKGPDPSGKGRVLPYI